jgi:hypothetical protein
MSPLQPRAKWALDHHGLNYEVVAHVPIFVQSSAHGRSAERARVGAVSCHS